MLDLNIHFKKLPDLVGKTWYVKQQLPPQQFLDIVILCWAKYSPLNHQSSKVRLITFSSISFHHVRWLLRQILSPLNSVEVVKSSCTFPKKHTVVTFRFLCDWLIDWNHVTAMTWFHTFSHPFWSLSPFNPNTLFMSAMLGAVISGPL